MRIVLPVFFFLFGSTVLGADPQTTFDRASQQATNGDLESAFETLQEALDAGYETPMDAVTDSGTAALVADPDLRPRVRELLREHAREHRATMVASDEPGRPFRVEGRLVDETTGAPIPGAVVELVQTDAGGKYFSENTKWNPRLFAYLRTGSDGAFEVKTIRPAGYPGDDGVMAPSHFHFGIEVYGYRPYHGEFLLESEPGALVAQIREIDGLEVGAITIALQPVPLERLYNLSRSGDQAEFDRAGREIIRRAKLLLEEGDRQEARRHALNLWLSSVAHEVRMDAWRILVLTDPPPRILAEGHQVVIQADGTRNHDTFDTWIRETFVQPYDWILDYQVAYTPTLIEEGQAGETTWLTLVLDTADRETDLVTLLREPRKTFRTDQWRILR